MTGTVVARPRFDVRRHAEVGRFLTDGRRLLEVAAVQLARGASSTTQRPSPRIRLVDCWEPIPVSSLEELLLGEWWPIVEAQKRLRVVRFESVR